MENNNLYTITEGTFEDFTLFYSNYKNDFPVHERKPLSHFKNLMETENYKLLLMREKKLSKFLGYALIFVIESEKTLWLDFIVINKEYQSSGFGSLFFNGITDFFGEEYVCIFMEVEIPDNSDDNQVRRLNYYERLNAKYINIDYKLPAPDEDFPIHLMYKKISKNKLLTNKIIENSIYSVYKIIHSDINTDKIFKEVIATLDFE